MVPVAAVSWSVITRDGTRNSRFPRASLPGETTLRRPSRSLVSLPITAYAPSVQLRDRHVVVTGAAGGIGSALARRFHADGARVVLTDLDGAPDVSRSLPGSISIAADQSNEAAINAMIDEAEAAFGPVDLYFANAGVAIGTDPMDDEATWQLAFAVNVHAHRWAARRLLPGWLERGEGYFCSTASAAGLLAQIGSAPYSVTKHAAV